MLILLSGPVGAGKTTLCLRLADEARLRGYAVSGALAPAVIEEDVKVGIDGLDVSTGERRPLARHAPAGGTFTGTRVGPYAFDDRLLDWMVTLCARALVDAEGVQGALVFVDEIGKLELDRGEGLSSLIPTLGQPHDSRVIVIVRESLLDRFLACVLKASPRVVVVNPERREQAWSELSSLVFGDRVGV